MAQFSDSHKRSLQRLMESADWQAVEAYIDYYMLCNFASASIKRNNEFETIWQAASNEGGVMHLGQLFVGMEQEVRSLIED
mgnify:CR=1 FL=1